MRSLFLLTACLTIGLGVDRLNADPIEGSLDLIVFVGDTLPGTGGVVSNVNGPVINNHGSVAFWGSSNGGTTFGVYRADNTGIVPIAITGGNAPDGNSTYAQFFLLEANYYAALNDSGEVAFNSELFDPNGNTFSRAVMIGDGNDTAIVVREGQTAPNGNGVFTDQYNSIRLNQAGQVAFVNTLTSTSGTLIGVQDVFRGDGTTLNTIFRSTWIDSNNSMGGPNVISLNDHGSVALGLGGVANGLITSSILLIDGSSTTAIATTPFGLPDGGLATYIPLEHRGVVNNAGEVVYYTHHSNLLQSEDSMVYIGDGLTTSLVAREGSAPLAGPGNNDLSGLNRSLALNDRGDIVFTTDAGVYYFKLDDNLQVVDSQQILADETQIGGGKQINTYIQQGNAINRSGQVAFITELNDVGQTTISGEAIFFYDPTAGLTEVIRTGDTYLSSTIVGLEFVADNGAGEEGTGLNDAGQIAFHFSLADGRNGISVWTPNAIPITGDLDGDGFVGIDDLNLVLSNWNQNIPPGHPLADPSGDGFVGIDDLNTVLGNWNVGTPPSHQSVPEPASLGLFLVSGTAMMRRTIKPTH